MGDGTDYRAIFCDGGCIATRQNGRVISNPSLVGGTWAYCAVDGTGTRTFESDIDRDRYFEIGGLYANATRVLSDNGVVKNTNRYRMTNNIMEMIALVKALEAMPDGWSGELFSDSRVTLGRVFEGYKLKNLPKNIMPRVRIALERLGRITWVHIQGHPTHKDLRRGYGTRHSTPLPVSIHNDFCDRLCKKAADEFTRTQTSEGLRILLNSTTGV